MKELAIVLLSGGMDSCVTAAIASQKYEIALLHFQYGQRTQEREFQSFKDIADYYKVNKSKVINADWLKEIGGSSLTDQNIHIPINDEIKAGIPSTYVPFRNTNLIAAAVSWAEVIGASKIFIGAVWEDSSGYPDCCPQYFEAYNKLIEVGTKPQTKITIETPIIHMKKSEIIKKGIELSAPLQYTWSCYQNNDIACGECDSCKLRLNAFKEAGIKDPIPYISF